MAIRIARLLALVVAIACIAMSAMVSANATESHALINGSGSGWSANAVNQWIADVESSGLRVVYTAAGSAQGRKDFGFGTNDFAVSDIGFQGVDSVTGDSDTSQGRDYAYLPIVAGGTSFPYQIRVAGELVRNLRLSGETLTKIFTNQITNWNDSEITKDNNGRELPSIPIIPVVHSEGSGSSAQLTRYFDTEYPQIWRPFLGRSGLTEYYPRKDSAIAQNGSDGVMNYVSSAAANGAIGYDEYSYALARDYPVAKVLNKNNYFTLPSQYNVAVALTQAQINSNKNSPDYLLQNLDKVYSYGDSRTYPLSSYSYAIIPTASDDKTMTTAKRQTLADYLYYSICQGQREVGPIGYSPLPINLVQASFDQIGQLKQADRGVDLSDKSVTTCDNPTFVAGQPNRNYLAEIAPRPPACDHVGNGPCTGAGDPGTQNPGPDGPDGGPGNGGGDGPGGNDDPGTAPGPGTPGDTPKGGDEAIDPITGEPIADPTALGGGNAVASPTDLSPFESPQLMTLLAVLSVALLVLAVASPPLLNRRLAKPRGES